MKTRLLILETSHRIGQIALAQGDTIVGQCSLDESRRHARDLAPTIKKLLQEQGWQARDLEGVLVSRGPGTYTGLRVGLMSAKTLAYATGCSLLAINTFDAIFQQAPASPSNIDCIADAQQDKVYVQRFGTNAEPLRILPFDSWLTAALKLGVSVTGPGLERFLDRVGTLGVLPPETWLPKPASLLKLGLSRFLKGERDELFAVEPLYLRASSAEENWDKLKARKV